MGVYVDYLVTVGGIANWDGSQWDDYDQGDGLAGPKVNALAIDSQDNVWIATSTGVSRMEAIASNAEEEASQNAFRLFPNPVRSELHLQFPENYTQKDNQVEIFNVAMQSIREQPIAVRPGTVRLNLEDLQPGIYFVRVGEHMEKFLKFE